MTTVSELLHSASRLATILATGETLSADEANDGLKVFNDLLENWSTENLNVWQQATIPLAATAGVSTYAIGPAATWNTTRPIRVHPSTVTLSGVDFPVNVWGYDQYLRLNDKDSGGIPEWLVYINDHPTGSVILYPVPAQAMTVNLKADRLLTFPATLATVLSYPPGYERALRYALAVNLAPEYGVQIAPDVTAIAKDSKGDIKRANRTRVTSQFDQSLSIAGGVGSWRWG